MRKRRGGYLIVALAIVSFFALSSMAAAGVTKVRCIVWQGDPAKYHTAISTEAAQLKAVINTDSTSAIYYKWVYGDGTPDAAVASLSGSTSYNIEVNHAYSGAVGTPFTAKLVAANDAALVTGVIEDLYLIKIEDGSNTDARINISIDKGLWWLFKNGNNLGGYASWPHTYDNSPFMAWLHTSQWETTLASPTASAIQAFAINGHKFKGNPNEDPYVEAVQQGMNYLVMGYSSNNSNCPELQAVVIGSVNHGGVVDNPEAGQASPNGYGIEVYGCRGHIPYQSGQIMDAIITSGVLSSDLTGRDFAPGTPKSHNWTYGELLQDMADMHAWGQSDTSPCNGGICGSWWYSWNSAFPGDNSASQWGAIGMLPAQQPPWNVLVPQWVKDYNANWLAYSMGCSGPSASVTSCSYNFFSYNSVGGCAGDSCLQTTTSGMVQMIFDGQTTADLKWGKAHKYIADRWQNFTHQGSGWGGWKTYGWYSFAKAMRLSLPSATTHLGKTSGAAFDWYYGNPSNATCINESNCEQGLAPRILEIQDANGSWSTGNMAGAPLTTAWMIITLKPVLFASAPIACFDYNPKSTYSGDTVTFNPACSGHSEAGKTIANLTLFEWDWDNDGTYDASSTTPSMQNQAFTCGTPPCSFPVTLRVTDDASLTATAKQTVTITNPPHPPVANAGGPYTVSLCATDSLMLDGSKSFDPDEGEHQAGCDACPNDRVTAWGWDLVPPLTGFGDKTGEKVTILGGSSNGQVGYYFTAGLKDIALQVTDNTALAFPGSGSPNLTDAKFATVQVYAANICNLAARPKSGKVQLTWKHTGAASYDIYRSETGPNIGFVLIKSGVVTSYATYLDEAVTNGTKYYYRVVNNTTGGGSNVASATPAGR